MTTQKQLKAGGNKALVKRTKKMVAYSGEKTLVRYQIHVDDGGAHWRAEAVPRNVVTPETVNLGEILDVADAKEKDFDLDLKAATYTAKKGQGGTRLKGRP